MRIWAQLHMPLSLIKLGDVWQIVIKGTNRNVLHNDNYVFVVFNNYEDAKDAFEKVKEIRRTVKYLKKIVIEG